MIIAAWLDVLEHEDSERLSDNTEAMPQLGAVEYAFVIVAAVLAVGLVLVARARRRDQRDRDELRRHIRRLGGPFDLGM